MELRFNHMEITFPSGALTAEFCGETERFYGDVFGFSSVVRPMFDRPSQMLSRPNGDFILLIEGDEAMTAPGFDHLGFELSSRDAVDEVLAKVKRWRGSDDRVELKEYPDGVLDGLLYHAFYLRHLLPIWFDVQHRVPAVG